MTMTRRAMSGTPLMGVVGLAACATTGSGNNWTASQLSTDVALIDQGLQAVGAALASIPGVSATLLAKVQGYLVQIKTDALNVAVATQGAPTSTIVDIANLVANIAKTVLPTISAIPGAAEIVVAISAAQAMIPVLLAAVGVPAPTALAAPKMSVAQARAVLATPL